MSNFSYDDFAVLVRSFQLDMLSSDSLRIVPLSDAPSMADAIHGTNLAGLDSESNLPKQKNGNVVRSNVTVQHDSEGYCRLVGHIEAVKPQGGQAGQEAPVTTAQAFVLYRTVTDVSDNTPKKEVIAVASLKEGFEIGDVCYPSFTITTVNNYQSVAFNPNAFATVEDLKNINGLDGLHIAFDNASGDLKLLDKDGNVLDQANLPIKADVIIADGEEGYKYVKTDVKQDIHAAKAWMPKDQTAWEDVPHVGYIRQRAALVVDQVSTPATRVLEDKKNEKNFPISTESVPFEHVVIGDSTYMLTGKTTNGCSLRKVKGEAGEPFIRDAGISAEGKVTLNNDSSHSYPITNGDVENVDVIKGEDGRTPYVLTGPYTNGNFIAFSLDSTSSSYSGTIVTSGGSSTDRVLGITTDGTNLYTFDEGAQPHSEINNISGGTVRWLDRKPLNEVPNHTLKYGLEAFVWTVKGDEYKSNDPFFNQLNASLLALGFHEGDDIALGTNLAELSPADGVSPLSGVDADDYMHGETKNELGKTNKELREQEVDEQRKFAKEELVAWNAQHPELKHDGRSGTRISSDGVDIRNGKILIGDGNGLGNDAVKHYELSTNFSSDSAYQPDQGLAFSAVTDASSGNLVNSNVLTISRYGYISGAPICMAMAEITESAEGAIAFTLIRRTSCFGCDIKEAEGTVTITITDNRLNSAGFSGECIVEISPVYISAPSETSAPSAHETLPALNMVNTVAVAVSDNPTQLTCTCPQIIDWANSVNISSVLGARMFVIVKVY